jgi:hypothetical protein
LFELAPIGGPGVGQNLNHKNADHLFFGIDPEARVSLELILCRVFGSITYKVVVGAKRKENVAVSAKT